MVEHLSLGLEWELDWPHPRGLSAQCCADVEAIKGGLDRKKAAEFSVGEGISSVLITLKIMCRAGIIT